MGREVRRVPADWQHPMDERGHHIPLLDGSFADAAAEWDEASAMWDQGLREDWSDWSPGPRQRRWMPKDGDALKHASYAEWAGDRPRAEHYMPDWPEAERTHMMMYENVSEGTPLSPAFETPQELARWLADNGASAFADQTATYDQWLAMCLQGSAPSVVIGGGQMQSGVAFVGDRAWQ